MSIKLFFEAHRNTKQFLQQVWNCHMDILGLPPSKRILKISYFIKLTNYELRMIKKSSEKYQFGFHSFKYRLVVLVQTVCLVIPEIEGGGLEKNLQLFHLHLLLLLLSPCSIVFSD